MTNTRRVAREIELGAYGKVLSGGRSNEVLRVGSLPELAKGAARQYSRPQKCKLCHTVGTSGRGLCFRCELECHAILHLLK